MILQKMLASTDIQDPPLSWKGIKGSIRKLHLNVPSVTVAAVTVNWVRTFQLMKENHKWLVVKDDEYESVHWRLFLVGTCQNTVSANNEG